MDGLGANTFALYGQSHTPMGLMRSSGGKKALVPLTLTTTEFVHCTITDT